MNERIKELALEAAYGNIDPNGPFTTEEFNQFTAKFAELVVRQCICLVINGKYDDEQFDANNEFHCGHNIALDGTAEGITKYLVLDFEKQIREDPRCVAGDWVACEVIEEVRRYIRNHPEGDIKEQIESAFHSTAHQ